MRLGFFLEYLSGIGFILTFRNYYWNIWQEKIKERVNKIENKYVISLEPLSIEDSRRFIADRLESPDFRLPTNCLLPTPYFGEELINVMWKESNGNPRAMLRSASTAFRIAVQNETQAIGVTGLKSSPDQHQQKENL